MRKIFVDCKEIDFFVVNKKGKIVNVGDEEFSTWEQTYIDLSSVIVGEKLSLSFNKDMHKRVKIDDYKIGDNKVKFVNRKGKEFIGELWRSYEKEVWTTLDYDTLKIEDLDTEVNLIVDDEIVVEDTNLLRYSENKGVITVFYDEFVLGNYTRFYDAEEAGREFMVVNNEVVYLDTIPYFVERNIALINNFDLKLDFDEIESLEDDSTIKSIELDNKKLPYGIKVNNSLYSYKSQTSRDADFKRLKFLFIRFFVEL